MSASDSTPNESAENADPNVPEPPSKEELRLAMKAFRKRLKLMQLDEESSLGHGPMSSGRRSEIVAIRPPDQFSKAIWRALAESGQLYHTGSGLYSLGKD
ncbi:hypothetical protein Poly51_45350 [Rubripirellula tenax]|uniref:Uncharacterized protein n=1 Tax=Rubripirellula tenax TaxID=2528015 RepID=A0A5C6EJE9_9BACT|nr:hypothetical protein [Rubripirellula tenax]TWU48634.1 hypothetical protein Poly51_45350 [Rubripirellula tenax]